MYTTDSSPGERDDLCSSLDFAKCTKSQDSSSILQADIDLVVFVARAVVTSLLLALHVIEELTAEEEEEEEHLKPWPVRFIFSALHIGWVSFHQSLVSDFQQLFSVAAVDLLVF